MESSRTSFASNRISELALSAIKDMAMRAAKLDDVATLAWGLPSFRTPTHIRDAVCQALKNDPDAGKYTLPDGMVALREAVAQTHHESTGILTCADRNVLVTAGNMQGVKVVLDTILKVDDEVILTDPCFVSHLLQLKISGGKPIFWPLQEKQGWAAKIDALEPLITSRTRAIILVTPSNPTGTVLQRSHLLAVADIARRHDLLIILDDPYSRFVFDEPNQYFKLASLDDLAARVVYLFTFSKCHAMSGWRLGYAVVPEELKRQMLKVHDSTLICAPRPSQIAGLAALTGDQQHLRDFTSTLKRRRSLICERLDRVRHVFSYVKPEGAYYVFPRIEAAHVNSRQFAIDLLKQAKVCVTPGSAFGPSGENHVRMSFCVAEDEINKAFDRIEKAFPV